MSYIFDMEIMTEEKVIDLRPSSILVRTVHSAVDVGVHCEDKPAGMISVSYTHLTLPTTPYV